MTNLSPKKGRKRMNLSKKKTALLALALVAVFVGSVWAAYYVGTLTGTVTIKNPVSWTPTAFTVSMYASESYTENITVTNAANVALNVTVSCTVSSPGNLTATAPSPLTLPAKGSTILPVLIYALPSAANTTYTVTVDIYR